MGAPPVLLTNIRLGWKGLLETNALAYSASSLMAKRPIKLMFALCKLFQLGLII